VIDADAKSPEKSDTRLNTSSENENFAKQLLTQLGPRSLCEITMRVGKALMRGRLVEDVGGSIVCT
jgi:hypothetical protein